MLYGIPDDENLPYLHTHNSYTVDILTVPFQTVACGRIYTETYVSNNLEVEESLGIRTDILALLCVVFMVNSGISVIPMKLSADVGKKSPHDEMLAYLYLRFAVSDLYLV